MELLSWYLILPEGALIASLSDPLSGKAVVTTDPYPDDIDTNCIAATILKPIDVTANSLLDEILTCANDDGIVQVLKRAP